MYVKDTNDNIFDKLDSSKANQVQFNVQDISFSVALRDAGDHQKLILVIEEGVALDAESRRGCPGYSESDEWPVFVTSKFMFVRVGLQ